MSNFVHNSLIHFNYCTSRSVAANAEAASTTVYAGDKRSISHKLFCGVTAAVAPNRQLCAGIHVFVVKFISTIFQFFQYIFSPNLSFLEFSFN